MTLEELDLVHDDLKKVQKRIEEMKLGESHFEKKRLLKMIDAELLDALHNMEILKKLFSL